MRNLFEKVELLCHGAGERVKVCSVRMGFLGFCPMR
jgi:hypothetical protein